MLKSSEEGKAGLESFQSQRRFPGSWRNVLFVTNVLSASFFLKTGEKRIRPFTNLQKNAQNSQSVGVLHGFSKVLVLGVPVNQVELQQQETKHGQ